MCGFIHLLTRSLNLLLWVCTLTVHSFHVKMFKMTSDSVILRMDDCCTETSSEQWVQVYFLQMSDLSFEHRWLYINLARLWFVSELVEDQWVTLFESSVPSIGLQYELSSPRSIESLCRYTNIDTCSLSCEIWQHTSKHLVNKRSWAGCIDCMLCKERRC